MSTDGLGFTLRPPRRNRPPIVLVQVLLGCSTKPPGPSNRCRLVGGHSIPLPTKAGGPLEDLYRRGPQVRTLPVAPRQRGGTGRRSRLKPDRATVQVRVLPLAPGRCGQSGIGSGPKPRDVRVRISPSAPRKAIPVLPQTGLTCTLDAVIGGSTPLSPTASGSSSKVEREKEHC